MRVHSFMDETPTASVVEVINPSGGGAVVIACEHASHFIPPELDNLGLEGDALLSHIAWDPGALAVARIMSSALDAPLVAQRVSRLVYDCNRAPGEQSAIPATSEIYTIPGNLGLSDAARRNRAASYFRPFHDTLATLMAGQLKSARRPALVTVHSFTPVYNGQRRTLEVGILHDSDSRLADEMLRLSEAEGAITALRNQPYGPDDGVTYTLAAHAVEQGLANVMIEIRNDLIADAAGQRVMAERLSRYLSDAIEILGAARDDASRVMGAN